MSRLHAQPIEDGIDGAFYFSNMEEFRANMMKYEDSCEEVVSIALLVGSKHNYLMFHAAKIDQTKLELWFGVLEGLSPRDTVAVCYLLSKDVDLTAAIDRRHEVNVYQGTALEYAKDYVDTCGVASDNDISHYIDFGQLARDKIQDGVIYVASDSGYIVTNCDEFS